MRKILAIFATVITIFAIKETVYIFTTTDPEILKHKSKLILVSLSITVPFLLLSLWLWSPKRKNLN